MTRDEIRRSRLRFDDLVHRTFPDGRCTITVRLEWRGEVFEGEAEGTQTQQGALRTAARAGLEAAARAADRDSLGLSLLGIKAIRAFDGWVIISSVRAAGDARREHLIGAKACTEDRILEAAVLTVLDALNRILEPYLSEPPDSPAPD